LTTRAASSGAVGARLLRRLGARRQEPAPGATGEVAAAAFLRETYCL